MLHGQCCNIVCMHIFSVYALSTIACAWCITIIARDTDRVVYDLPCANKWDTYVLSVYTTENKCKTNGYTNQFKIKRRERIITTYRRHPHTLNV